MLALSSLDCARPVAASADAHSYRTQHGQQQSAADLQLVVRQPKMYPPSDDADPTDERMVSALNFALSGRGDAADDAALALGLVLAGRSGGHGARHSSLSPSESSVASTTSMMSTSSFASSLAPSDAPADEHVVLPGDTLAGLCIRYGVSARSLRRLNRLDGDQVMQHAILRIPPARRGRRQTPQAQTPDVLAARQRLAFRESGAWTEDESFRVAIRILNGRRVR